jgi:hypothetical protein
VEREICCVDILGPFWPFLFCKLTKQPCVFSLAVKWHVSAPASPVAHPARCRKGSLRLCSSTLAGKHINRKAAQTCEAVRRCNLTAVKQLGDSCPLGRFMSGYAGLDPSSLSLGAPPPPLSPSPSLPPSLPLMQIRRVLTAILERFRQFNADT